MVDNDYSVLLMVCDVSHLRTEDVLQHIRLDSERPIHIVDMYCQGRFVCCLTAMGELYVLKGNNIGLSWIPRSCVGNHLELVNKIAIAPSASIPQFVIPLTTVAPVSTPVEFGAEKGEEKEVDVNQVIVLNHDQTADLINLRDQERRMICNDVLTLFLVHGDESDPSFCQESVVFFGKHRMNVCDWT